MEPDDPDLVAVPVEEPDAPDAEPVAEEPPVAEAEEPEPVAVASALRLEVQTWTSEAASAYCGHADRALSSSELLAEYHERTASV